MKTIYDTKIDAVIEWIDEHIARGFYSLFDKCFRFRWRIANLILHDELRWMAIEIDNAYDEREPYNAHRFEYSMSKLKTLSDDISKKESE